AGLSGEALGRGPSRAAERCGSGVTNPLVLLGFVPRGVPAPPAAPPHHCVPFGELSAIVINADTHNLERQASDAILELAVTQNSLLSAYCEAHDVLPVALGAVFSCEAAVIEHLCSEESRIWQHWSGITGRAEYLVTLDLDSSIPEPAPRLQSGGVEYLRARRRIRDDRAMQADRRLRCASDICRTAVSCAERHVVSRTGHGRLASLSLLVRRGDVGAMTESMEDAASEAEKLGLLLRVIGPCAPTSFIEEGDEFVRTRA
ncbi:MAG: GvpL/GvpF family gas vesicle protein, partial [Pseudomonadota bacterium]